MTDQEESLLRHARRGLSPSDADRARVFSALSMAVLPAPSAPPAPTNSPMFQAFVGVLAMGVAGAVGYGFGYRAGNVARPAPVAVATAAAAPSVVVVAPVPAAAPAAIAEAPPGAPVTRAAARASAPAPSAAPAPEVGLDEEVRQLRRIERALRDGNPRLALVIAEDLDRAAPRGQLRIERRAASLMAQCALTEAGAPAEAARFLEQNPSSPYGARLRQLCDLSPSSQRNPSAPGTDPAKDGGSK